MVEDTETGGRRIRLYLPFDFMGKRVEAITIRAPELNDVLRWEDGLFESSLALLAEMSGENEPTLRKLKYPDADRVLGEWILMLPAVMQDTIRQRLILPATPTPQDDAIARATPGDEPAATADEGAGFDMGEQH